jgi:sulfatase maturation enzyme AslB (radical SAM superfamily)
MCSIPGKVRNTFIIICEDMCPPSEESKLPGSPADSQLEQMSIESQIAQWNRAPSMSCKQLNFIRYCNHVAIGHLLCTLDAGMFHGYKHRVKYDRELLAKTLTSFLIIIV